MNICLLQPLNDPNVDHQGSGLDLPAGVSHINGTTALEFVRDRHSYANEDLGREQAQQRFISAMIRKVSSPSILLDPLKFNRILTAGVQSVETDMNGKQLLDFAKEMSTYKPSDVSFLTVPVANSSGRLVPGVGSVLDWDPTLSGLLFSSFRNDTPLNGSASATLAPAADVTVQVYNGTGIAGLGARTSAALAGFGFKTAGPAKTATGGAQATTTIAYAPAYAKEAATVKAAIPGATLQQTTTNGATIQVTLGSNFTVVKSPVAPTKPKLAVKTAANNICG